MNAITPINDKVISLLPRLGRFRGRAEAVFGRIADHLADVEALEFSAPVPREPDEPAEPMFDSRRDYLTQIEHYHAWQGRGEGRS